MPQISNNEKYQYYKELLSCLSDGELSSQELEELMKGLQGYPELNAYWLRLQLKSSVLKNDPVQLITMQWLNKIKGSLESGTESAQIISLPQSSVKTSNQKKQDKEKFSVLTNFAIAASIMFFVVTIWLSSQPNLRALALAYIAPAGTETGVNEQINTTQIAITKNMYSNNKVLVSSGNISTKPSETVNDLYLSKSRVENYMLLHAENASLNTNQGLLPFARMNRVSNGKQF